mmetsp:Transcript_109782/g.321439  ORF Transcript_109782/g.321439 Transcript_109782/m.321439 type:complete len:627 (+) Transcript_109782:602-2482(+)
MCCRAWITQVVDQESCHEGHAELLIDHLQRPEDVHATISRCEGGVARDGGGRSGRRNIAADRVAIGPGNHGAPVLQALRKDVVGALVGHDGVHVGQSARPLRHAARLEHSQGLPEPHPERGALLRRGGRLCGLLGNQGDICGSAEEGQSSVAPRPAELVDDAVAGHCNLHMQRAIQVGVVADGHLLAGGYGRDPGCNLGCLCQQVTSARSSQAIPVTCCCQAAPVDALFDREDELSRAILHLFEELLQCLWPGNCDNRRTTAQQEWQWPHGRSSTQQHKVHVAQVQPLLLVLLEELQRISRVSLDAAVLCPGVHLLSQLQPVQPGLALGLEAVVGLAGGRAAVEERQLRLLRHLAAPAQLRGLEALRGPGLAHRGLHGDLGLGAPAEGEGLLRGVEPGARHGEAGLGALEALAHVLHEVPPVAEAPAPLPRDPRGGLLAARPRARGGGKDAAVRGRGGAVPLLRRGPDHALRLALPRLALLEAALSVDPHVHDHARAAGEVEQEDDRAEAVPKGARRPPMRTHADQRLEELACDAGGIQHKEEGVTQVEQHVRHRAEQRAEVEEVADHLCDAPREDDQHQRPMLLAFWHKVQVTPDDEDPAHDLHCNCEHWAWDKAQRGMRYLQEH